MTHSSDKQFAIDIINGAPISSKAWLSFDHSVADIPSQVPSKYKELIAIAVALTTQCPYCIEKHITKAKEQGITQEEIAETIMIAAALRSGAALGYGLLAMKLFKSENNGG
ncbi:AhpD family alkylhydroperoxidase [Chitinophaga skermanii]|uniref:AhpD family alkylhydroperoxidase n=1 Tax=Chitinophaga skermanii TaxID=331697 RepID=A0A327Q7X9_9BACT|nr:carboxymuconolactone decarboxylase family protein [Chitinophaga skermanii]RAJ00411.1 AhpD family alkylhydroperoxidase [Chitinophaga skermanii]